MIVKLNVFQIVSKSNLVSVQIIIVMDPNYQNWSMIMIRGWIHHPVSIQGWWQPLSLAPPPHTRALQTDRKTSLSRQWWCFWWCFFHDSDHFDDDNDHGDLDAVDAPIKESSTTVCLGRQSRSVLVVVLISLGSSSSSWLLWWYRWLSSSWKPSVQKSWQRWQDFQGSPISWWSPCTLGRFCSRRPPWRKLLSSWWL